MTGAALGGGAARAVLEQAVAAGAFPGAAADAGTSAASVWAASAGRLTYEPDAPRVTGATLYDLASLTKVIATTSVAMRLVSDRTVSLDDPASIWMPEWAAGRELANGELVALFDAYTVGVMDFEIPVWMLYVSRRHLPLKVRVFVEFMQEQFQKKPPWHS